MSQHINLKELEKKAWKSYFQDGLWDIFLGLILLAMAVNDLVIDIGLSKSWEYGIFIGVEGLALLVLFVGKKFITVPRIGHVKFGPTRKAKNKKVVIILTITFLINVMLYILLATRSLPPGWENWLKENVLPFGFGVFIILVFSLIAYFMDFNRLYIHGTLFGLAVPVDKMMEKYTDFTYTGLIAFSIPTTISLLIGLTVFIRFLRNYPLPAKEVLQ